MPKTEELMTVKELAAFFKVPVSTVYGWRYTGDGPTAIRVGRYLRYRRSDVEAFLDERADRERRA